MSDYPFRKRLPVALLLLLLSSAGSISLAAPVATPWQQERTLHAADSGLLYSLPQIDRRQLGNEIDQLNLALKARQKELAGELADSRLTAGHAVLAAVLPGGLIYAAVKRHRAARAEAELQQVASQLEALQDFPQQTPPSSPLLAAR